MTKAGHRGQWSVSDGSVICWVKLEMGQCERVSLCRCMTHMSAAVTNRRRLRMSSRHLCRDQLSIGSDDKFTYLLTYLHTIDI